MTTATNAGAQQRTIPITRHQPDRLIHLNRTLTRITAFTMTGPVKKHSEACYSVPSVISCRQGEIPWLAHAYLDPTKHDWKIYGTCYLGGTYAIKPIHAAIFKAIGDLAMQLNAPLVVKVKAHGRLGRWQWATCGCPFCGAKQHFHGAGDGIEPTLLGNRRAHCLPQDLEKLGITSRPTYELVEL